MSHRSLTHWYMLIISVMLVGIFVYSSLAQNIARVRSLRQVLTCVSTYMDIRPKQTIGYILWAGDTQPIPCSYIEGMYGLDDIAALATWLRGEQLVTSQIAGIIPTWRRNLFDWRNRNWQGLPISVSSNPNENIALFTTQLALWSRNHATMERALYFAQISLKTQPDEHVARMLISGFGSPRTADEVSVIHTLRQAIAQALPDYVFNYVDWFETMVSSKAWDKAAEACQGLQKHAVAPYEVNATICEAQLAYYQGDYAEAYKLLHIANAHIPNNVKVLIWFGRSTMKLKRYNEAEQIFQQAIQIGGTDNELLNLYWHLGDCQRILGKIVQARQSYQVALSYATSQRYRQELTRILQNLL